MLIFFASIFYLDALFLALVVFGAPSLAKGQCDQVMLPRTDRDFGIVLLISDLDISHAQQFGLNNQSDAQITPVSTVHPFIRFFISEAGLL